MEEAISSLRMAEAQPSDQWFCALVELQIVLDDASQSFGFSSAYTHSLQSDRALDFQIGMLNDRLDSWTRSSARQVDRGKCVEAIIHDPV